MSDPSPTFDGAPLGLESTQSSDFDRPSFRGGMSGAAAFGVASAVLPAPTASSAVAAPQVASPAASAGIDYPARAQQAFDIRYRLTLRILQAPRVDPPTNGHEEA